MKVLLFLIPVILFSSCGIPQFHELCDAVKQDFFRFERDVLDCDDLEVAEAKGSNET